MSNLFFSTSFRTKKPAVHAGFNYITFSGLCLADYPGVCFDHGFSTVGGHVPYVVVDVDVRVAFSFAHFVPSFSS